MNNSFFHCSSSFFVRLKLFCQQLNQIEVKFQHITLCLKSVFKTHLPKHKNELKTLNILYRTNSLFFHKINLLNLCPHQFGSVKILLLLIYFFNLQLVFCNYTCRMQPKNSLFYKLYNIPQHSHLTCKMVLAGKEETLFHLMIFFCFAEHQYFLKYWN